MARQQCFIYQNVRNSNFRESGIWHSMQSLARTILKTLQGARWMARQKICTSLAILETKEYQCLSRDWILAFEWNLWRAFFPKNIKGRHMDGAPRIHPWVGAVPESSKILNVSERWISEFNKIFCARLSKTLQCAKWMECPKFTHRLGYPIKLRNNPPSSRESKSAFWWWNLWRAPFRRHDGAPIGLPAKNSSMSQAMK